MLPQKELALNLLDMTTEDAVWIEQLFSGELPMAQVGIRHLRDFLARNSNYTIEELNAVRLGEWSKILEMIAKQLKVERDAAVPFATESGSGTGPQ